MATVEVYANNAATTLNGGINNVVTSLIVTSASGFPSTGNFRILVDAEIMLVTAVSGTTFTVTRGVESTTATTHGNGAAVTHILTAGSLAQGFSDRNSVPCGSWTSSNTISDSTTTAITWTIADDPYALLTGGSGGTKFQPPHNGYYLFNGYIHWASNASGIRIIEWRLNGTVYGNGSGTGVSPLADARQEVTLLLKLLSTDYIELTCFQSSGGNLGFITATAAMVLVKATT
jgi:hypothetical protein